MPTSLGLKPREIERGNLGCPWPPYFVKYFSLKWTTYKLYTSGEENAWIHRICMTSIFFQYVQGTPFACPCRCVTTSPLIHKVKSSGISHIIQGARNRLTALPPLFEFSQLRASIHKFVQPHIIYLSLCDLPVFVLFFFVSFCLLVFQGEFQRLVDWAQRDPMMATVGAKVFISHTL